jgi:hypothetical protein
MEDNVNINKLFDEADVDEGIDNVTINSIEDELGIPTVKVDVDIHYEKAESKGDKEDYQDDLAYSRNVLLKSLGTADKILESLMKKIAANDQITVDDETSPRIQVKYYEITPVLVKSICDASKELINLHISNTKVKNENSWNSKEDTKNAGETTNDVLRKLKLLKESQSN